MTPAEKQLFEYAESKSIFVIKRNEHHCQIFGDLLINYYPNSRRKTAYIAGTKLAVERVTPQQAVDMSCKPPEVVAQDERDRRAKSNAWRKSRMIATHGPVCVWCCGVFAESDLTVDHRVPLMRGGLDNMNNLVLACGPCNHSRGADMPEMGCVKA